MSERHANKKPPEQLLSTEAGTEAPTMPVIPRVHNTAEFFAVPAREAQIRNTAPGTPAIITAESRPGEKPETNTATSKPSVFTPDNSRMQIPGEHPNIQSTEKGDEDVFIMHWLHPDEIHTHIETYGKNPNNMQYRMMKLAKEKASWHIGSDTVLPKNPFDYLYDQFIESIRNNETAQNPIVAHLVEKWNNHELNGTITPTDFETLYKKERDIEIDITQNILEDSTETDPIETANIAKHPGEITAVEVRSPQEAPRDTITSTPKSTSLPQKTPSQPQILQRTTPEKPPSRFWKKFTTRVGVLAASLAVAFGIYKANDTHENTPVQTTEASPDTQPTIEELSPTQVRTAVASTQQVLEEVIDEGSSRQSSDEVVHRIVERIAQHDTPEGRIPEAQIEPVIASTQSSITELIRTLNKTLSPENITTVARHLESIVSHVRETLEPLVTPTQTKPEVHLQHTQTPITLRIGNADGESTSVWGTLDRLEQMDIRRPDGTPQWSDHAAFHTWRMNELRRLGYEQRDGQWGHPFTVHDGAQIRLSFDTSGNPHVELLDPTKQENPTVSHYPELRFNATATNTADTTPPNIQEKTNTTEKQGELQKNESTEYTDVDINGTKIHTGDTIQMVSKSGKPIQYTITKITSANGPKRLILRSLDGKINTFKDIKTLEKNPSSFSLLTKEKITKKNR